MAPRKAADKGKAKMTNAEEVNRPVTRSQGMGIVIKDMNEAGRRLSLRSRVVESERESQKVAPQIETVEPGVGTPDELVEEASLRAQAKVPGPNVETLVQQAMQRMEERMIARMETMEGMLQTLQEHIRAQGQQRTSSVQQKRPLSPKRKETPESEPVRSRRRRRSKAEKFDRNACFRCGQFGHKKVSCPQLQRPASEQAWQRPVNQMVCYQCRQPGHRRWECPQLQLVVVPQAEQWRQPFMRDPVAEHGKEGESSTISATLLVDSVGASEVETIVSSHVQTIISQETQTAEDAVIGNL